MWPEKNGPGWRIRDRVAGRVVTVSTHIYPNKTAARAAMVLLKADAARGEGLVPRGGQMLLDEWIDEWWPRYDGTLSATAKHSEGGRVRNHIRPLLGRHTLDELEQKPSIIEEWLDDLTDGVGKMGEEAKRRGKPIARRPLAPKTIRNCHGLLHVILGAAIQRKLIRTNPCAISAKSLPTPTEYEMRFLTDEEIARLVAAIPPFWRPLVVLLVATGLRWGEAIGLRAGRVNLRGPRASLRVVEQLQELSSTGEMLFCPPKTKRSRRTVSFTAKVAAVLAPLVSGKAPDAAVFLAPGGGLVRTRNFRRMWLKATAAAGLPGLRIHDLRHTHVAVLIAANRQMSAISRRLGHASISITDAIYGHLREEVDEGILDATDGSLSLVVGVFGPELEAEIEAELHDELDLAA